MKKPAKPVSPVTQAHQRVTSVRKQLHAARSQTVAQMQAAKAKKIASLRKQLHLAKHQQRVAQRAAHHHHAQKVAKATSKKRGWSPDEDVALCSARAFAESLRLAGRGAVSDSAVLDVYWATAGSADSGASIVATAEAILAGGLGGHYLGHGLNGESARPDVAVGCAQVPGIFAGDFLVPLPSVPDGVDDLLGRHTGSLILGVALPEPHAVTVDPAGGWWSWGEPFDPADWPGMVIEEAWAVTWRP